MARYCAGMSEGNVEAVRRIYADWSEGDFQSRPELLDPLVLFVMGEGLPDTGQYLGVGQLAKYMRGFLEPWERLTIEAEEIIPAGDSLFAAVVQRGVGSGSGAATELRYFHVWSLRTGKVIRLETLRDRSAALAAVGLPDQA